MATKEDLEAAVIKSIVHAPLTIDEVLALYETESSELMEEFELTSGQLTKVNFWMQQQAQRLIAQEQLQPNRKLEEKKKIKGLSKNQLKRIILEEKQRLISENRDSEWMSRAKFRKKTIK